MLFLFFFLVRAAKRNGGLISERLSVVLALNESHEIKCYSSLISYKESGGHLIV